PYSEMVIARTVSDGSRSVVATQRTGRPVHRRISKVPAMAHFGDLAKDIDQRGLAGDRPDLPMTADGLEAAARQVLPPGALSYVAGGASTERTIAANREAFARWRIVPRMLRGVTERDLSTTVLGT